LSRWNNDQQQDKTDEQDRIAADVHGFGSLSRRQSTKPIVAAVSGGAYGGGMEIILNCDIVVAGEDAKFALPEVKRGVVAIQGGEDDIFRYHESAH
jgi:enoyl-CoA hydratase/carnithine racemase